MTDLSEWDRKLPYRPPHSKKSPKPNRPIDCPRSCGATQKEHTQLYTRPGAYDFYWRYYKCDRCDGNFWVGVQYDTHDTVVTLSAPKIENTTFLTGNLRFILPEGHPLVTPEYKKFLKTGELPKDVRWAIEEEREAAGRAADAADRAARGEPEPMQVNEEPTTPNPEVTSISNAEAFPPEEDDGLTPEDDPDFMHRWEFSELLRKQNIQELADEQREQLYQRWLAAVYPTPKP